MYVLFWLFYGIVLFMTLIAKWFISALALIGAAYLIDGISVDITPDIRSIFKLYADKASKVYGFGENSKFIVDCH